MMKSITLEEGLSILEVAIEKAKRILDGYPINVLFSSEEYMKYYDCVYSICIHHQPNDHSWRLYERFKYALEEGIYSRVLPALKDKNNAPLLVQLSHMWANYKMMAKCLGGFFLYLDRHYSDGKHAASLKDVSVNCFHDLVCVELHEKILDAAVFLINQGRDQNLIDWNLLKNVSTFFLEIGENENTKYHDHFESAVLAASSSYYSQMAPIWLQQYSYADYILQVKCCLNQEKERASQYLSQTSVEKLLQVVQSNLVGMIASQLMEKQKAENRESITYQDLLKSCASLNIGDRSQDEVMLQ